MATNAADCYDEIRAAMGRIKPTEPKCPTPGTYKTLADCLRNINQCPKSCPHYDVWVGPKGN